MALLSSEAGLGVLKPPGYSHKLQVLVGGQLSRNQRELVPVQVATGEDTTVSAPSPPAPCWEDLSLQPGPPRSLSLLLVDHKGPESLTGGENTYIFWAFWAGATRKTW